MLKYILCVSFKDKTYFKSSRPERDLPQLLSDTFNTTKIAVK